MEQKSTVCLPCLFLRMKLLNYTQGTRLSASQATCAGLGCGSTPLITSTQEAGLSQKSKEHFVLLLLCSLWFCCCWLSVLVYIPRWGWGIRLWGSEDNLRGSDNFCLVDLGYWTQFLGLGGKHFNLPSHLASPWAKYVWEMRPLNLPQVCFVSRLLVSVMETLGNCGCWCLELKIVISFLVDNFE